VINYSNQSLSLALSTEMDKSIKSIFDLEFNINYFFQDAGNPRGNFLDNTLGTPQLLLFHALGLLK
jgi:hypothetical protein